MRIPSAQLRSSLYSALILEQCTKDLAPVIHRKLCDSEQLQSNIPNRSEVLSETGRPRPRTIMSLRTNP